MTCMTTASLIKRAFTRANTCTRNMYDRRVCMCKRGIIDTISLRYALNQWLKYKFRDGDCTFTFGPLSVVMYLYLSIWWGNTLSHKLQMGNGVPLRSIAL